jgi:hypothetical protein
MLRFRNVLGVHFSDDHRVVPCLQAVVTDVCYPTDLVGVCAVTY